MVKYIIFFLCVLTLESQANMHRRARHFNARDAGASLVLDSRFITGLADGDPVSTWSDRSGNGYTIEQTTASSRPTLQVSGINGCAAVRFDGSDDFLNGGNILNMGTNSLTMIVVAKRTSGSANTLCGKSRADGTPGRYSMLRESDTFISLYGPAASIAFNATQADTATAPRINVQEIERGVANRLIFNGAQQASAAITSSDTDNHNTTDSFFVGAYQSSSGTTPPLGGYYWNGDIGQIIVLFKVNQSLRKRLEHTASLSFKIPCN